MRIFAGSMVLLVIAIGGTVSAQEHKSAAGWTTTRPASPVEPGAKLERLAGGFGFTEGPTSDEKGNILFTDQNNNRIWEWSIDSKLSVWLEPSKRANGMCFDGKGNLIGCCDELSQLISISPDRKMTVLVKDYQGKYLNGPNDVWVRPDGGMYITDPYYKRDWWQRRGTAVEQDKEAVYFLSPDGKKLMRVIDDFEKPNGVIGTPDGNTLYVSDIKGGKTFLYRIETDGSLTGKQFFCAYGSDGMTIDSDGNVYTTSQGAVQIHSPAGKLLDVIPVHGANCCFGGADGRLLFITARDAVYGLRMKTKRVGPQ